MAERKKQNSHRRHSYEGSQKILRIAGISSIVLGVLILIVATLSINLTLIVEGGEEPLVLVYGKDEYVRPEAIGLANGESIKVSVYDSVVPN